MEDKIKKDKINLKITDVTYYKEDGYWFWIVDRNGTLHNKDFEIDHGSKKKPTLQQIKTVVKEHLIELDENVREAISERDSFKYEWFD